MNTEFGQLGYVDYRTRYGSRFWSDNYPWSYAGTAMSPGRLADTRGSVEQAGADWTTTVSPNAPTPYGYGDPYGIWPFTPRAGTPGKRPFAKIGNTLLDVGAFLGGAVLTASGGGLVGVGLMAAPLVRGAAKRRRQNAVEPQVRRQRQMSPGPNRAMMAAVQNKLGRYQAAAGPAPAPSTYDAGGMVYEDPGETGLPWGWIVAGLLVAGAGAWWFTRKKR